MEINSFLSKLMIVCKLITFVHSPLKENLIDYGSGSGIPGLVWAILNEKIKVSALIPARKK